MALYTPSNLPLTHLRCSRALLVAVLTLGSASISRAEAQVVRTPQGVVEFIGLRSWTVDMIRDSMRVHAPGEPLCQCAGVLRGLGFPAAAATGVGGDTTVVLLVEPAFADRIQRRVVPADSTSPDRWPVAQRLLAVGRGHPWQSAVQLGDWWTAAIPSVVRSYDRSCATR